MQSNPLHKKRIAIIGGGFTGLTAALDLSKAGYSVTIIEKADTLGGLANGEHILGYPIENAYHHLFETDKYILELIDQLGLKEKIKWLPAKTAIFMNGLSYPFSSAIDLLKFTPIGLIARIRTGLVILYLKLQNNWRNLDNISAFKWLERWNGKSAFPAIWKPLLQGKFHNYSSTISMAWLWARLHVRANSKNGAVFGYPKNSFSEIVQVLTSKLQKQGCTIKTKCHITNIEIRKNEFIIGHNGKPDLHFDSILVAAPNATITKLFPHLMPSGPFMQKINNIHYLGAITLIFVSSQNLSDYYWTNINDSKFPFIVCIHHTAFAPIEWYGGNYIYYLASYLPHDNVYFQMEEKQLAQEWLGMLKKVWPKFESSQVKQTKIHKFTNAQHVPILRYREQIPDTRTPIKNLYLSNFSQIFPEDRGINFAVREGRKVAQMMISDME